MAQPSGIARLVGVQRAVQNNGNMKSEAKYLAVKDLQYMLSTVELFLFSSCFLGFYGGLTSWFYSLSESLAVGCVHHMLLHLTPPNTYIAKAQPCCPSRPPSAKNAVPTSCIMHVVSDILPGRDLNFTFLSATAN